MPCKKCTNICTTNSIHELCRLLMVASYELFSSSWNAPMQLHEVSAFMENVVASYTCPMIPKCFLKKGVRHDWHKKKYITYISRYVDHFIEKKRVRKIEHCTNPFTRTTTSVPFSREVLYHASEWASSSSPSTYISNNLDFGRKIYPVLHMYSFISIVCSQVQLMFHCTTGTLHNAKLADIWYVHTCHMPDMFEICTRIRRWQK